MEYENNFPNLTQSQLNVIAEHMDDDIREQLASAADWQHPGEFLTAYLEQDPEFPVSQFVSPNAPAESVDSVLSVVIDDGTVGVGRGPLSVGDTATIRLRDENGNPISATGRVVEVLGEDESVEAVALMRGRS